jgi:hypothetical protein
LASGRLTPDVLIQALDIVKNDILKAIAKHEAEQEAQAEDLEEIQEDMQELELKESKEKT